MKERLGIYGSIGKRNIKTCCKGSGLSLAEQDAFQILHSQNFITTYMDGSSMSYRIKSIAQTTVIASETMSMKSKYHSQKLKVVKRVC